MHGWLRPGALLLVGVPNPDSLQAQIGGRAWLHFDAPRHRTHFTPAGLTRALERGGFEVERIEHLVWQQNPLGMWLAILARLGMRANLPLHVIKRTVNPTPRELVALVAGVALVPPAIVAELLAAAAGRGGTIAAVGRVH
jgi:hypothetical protein